MTLILNIETATKVCSVSVTKDGDELAVKDFHSENFTHSENLNLFIQELFNQLEYTLNDLDAIAVSSGPGSYTGLRIGTSSAKGLCYGLNIPLIAIDSLKSLAARINEEEVDLICPMFDARRMEVYCAIYQKDLSVFQEVEAKVIDETSFLDLLEEHKILFIGPGSEKVQEVINHPNAIFNSEIPVSASGMNQLSYAKFQQESFEDVAYFEPNYLKDFIAGKPKKHF
ncbi:MAG: tRNA (adenosine(37)-N6)-threonylcarbamoyltransferase complex dimerization subunit type 1 TsaB [Flavobacteriales bacterium]|nr:tRNA (adenosine(37)-N6)-threonylcarbamoyltransferase complex dimerization subunit type 1 TsaB [Flavobacteriales bacterium]